MHARRAAADHPRLDAAPPVGSGTVAGAHACMHAIQRDPRRPMRDINLLPVPVAWPRGGAAGWPMPVAARSIAAVRPAHAQGRPGTDRHERTTGTGYYVLHRFSSHLCDAGLSGAYYSIGARPRVRSAGRSMQLARTTARAAGRPAGAVHATRARRAGRSTAVTRLG